MEKIKMCLDEDERAEIFNSLSKLLLQLTATYQGEKYNEYMARKKTRYSRELQLIKFINDAVDGELDLKLAANFFKRYGKPYHEKQMLYAREGFNQNTFVPGGGYIINPVLKEDYTKPAFNWGDIPPGTPVLTSNNGEVWSYGYFAYIDDGNLIVTTNKPVPPWPTDIGEMVNGTLKEEYFKLGVPRGSFKFEQMIKRGLSRP